MGKERQTLTRRELLRMIGGAGAAALVAACGPSTPQFAPEVSTLPPPTKPSEAPSAALVPAPAEEPTVVPPTVEPSLPLPEPTPVVAPTEVPILAAGGEYPDWYNPKARYVTDKQNRIWDCFKKASKASPKWFGAEIVTADSNPLVDQDNFHFKLYFGDKVGEVMVALEPPVSSGSYKNTVFTFGIMDEPIPMSLEEFNIDFRFHPANTFVRLDRDSGRTVAFLDWPTGTWTEISKWEGENFSWVGPKIDCDGIKIKLAVDNHYPPEDERLGAWTVMTGDICEALTRKYYENHPDKIEEWGAPPIEEVVARFRERNPDKDILKWIGNSIKAALTQVEVIEMEIMPDHVHLLVEVDPQYGVHQFIRQTKGQSSRILRQEFPWLKSRLPTLWSNSYFVSTVGGTPLAIVKQYIENQKHV